MAKTKKLSPKYQTWVDARKKFRLSHAQIQMARELGLNPNKFEKMANHRQETWKLPIGEYIEKLYQKHFGRSQPENVRSIEESLKVKKAKNEARKQRKLAAKAQAEGNSSQEEHPSDMEKAPTDDVPR